MFHQSFILSFSTVNLMETTAQKMSPAKARRSCPLGLSLTPQMGWSPMGPFPFRQGLWTVGWSSSRSGTSSCPLDPAVAVSTMAALWPVTPPPLCFTTVARLTSTHLETSSSTGSIWASSPSPSTPWGHLEGCCSEGQEWTCRCRQVTRKDWAALLRTRPCSTPPTQAVWTDRRWSWRGFTPWLPRTGAPPCSRSAPRQVRCSWEATAWSRYRVESPTVMAAHYSTAMWVFLHCSSHLPHLPQQSHKVGSSHLN